MDHRSDLPGAYQTAGTNPYFDPIGHHSGPSPVDDLNARRRGPRCPHPAPRRRTRGHRCACAARVEQRAGTLAPNGADCHRTALMTGGS